MYRACMAAAVAVRFMRVPSWSGVLFMFKLNLCDFQNRSPEVQIRLRSPTAKIFFHSPLITAVSLASAHAYTAKRTNSPRKSAFRTQPRKNIHATKHFARRLCRNLKSSDICSVHSALLLRLKIQPGACVFSFCECGMCKIGRLRNPTPESNVQVVRTSMRNQPSNIGPGGWGK